MIDRERERERKSERKSERERERGGGALDREIEEIIKRNVFRHTAHLLRF